MSHVRTTIRQAVVATLIAAGTAAGSRVFDHPYNPRKTFPALVVEDLGANFSESNITEAQTFADLNGNVVTLRATASGCDDLFVSLTLEP